MLMWKLSAASSPSWWLISQKINNQKALKHIWQQLLESSASRTVVKRHCHLCGGLACTESSHPASKLSQALYPLKLRHLYRTVTSGRLGAKRLRLSDFLSEGIFQGCGGIPTSVTSGVWFCINWCFSTNYYTPHKKKNIVTIYENNLEFPLNTLKTGLTTRG